MALDLRSERDVETKFIGPLFRDVLEYPDEGLHWDEPVKIVIGRQRLTKKADLVAFHGKTPVVAVEAKSPREAVRSGLSQVDSYAFALRTKFSVVTNGLQFVVRGYYAGNNRINVIDSGVEELTAGGWSTVRNLIGAPNITASMQEPDKPVPPIDNIKIQDYRKFFRKIHNEIRDRDKLAPDAAFDELSKLLFLKAAEAERDRPILTSTMIEQWQEFDNAKALAMANEWFQSATAELFAGVFDDRPRLTLSPATLAVVLDMLKDFYVRNGDVDVKGRAFEEFLPSQLRGKGLGQFFTPRPVVNLMVDMAGVSIRDVVVDFSCGSGGFLIKAFEQMKRGVDQLPEGTFARLGTTRDAMLDDIRSSQIFGVDAEPRAARTAKMNMIMWGDGRRVVRGNALDTKDHSGIPYEPREYTPNDPVSGCTVILANPPFGSTEKDENVLKRYTLPRVGKHGKPKPEKTEVLFIEKGLKLLRPEGKLLIVLPEGLLSSTSNTRIRDYIHAAAEIRAIISLPRHTFTPSGVPMVNTCVVFLQKFTDEKRRLFDAKIAPIEDAEEQRMALRSDPDFDYPIFMGVAENIGYEPNGRSTVKSGEFTDLTLLLNDYMNSVSVADTDIFQFANERFGERPMYEDAEVATKESLRSSFVVNLSETTERLDPPYYLLHHRENVLLESLTPLGNRIKEIKDFCRPRTDAEMDAEYDILSVSSDGLVTWNERKKGEAFRRMKWVRAGDIAYNPMRINIGSIGVVPSALDGALVSPDYVVVRPSGINADLLVTLLRAPFYRMYIDVMTTGSIRDRLYFGMLQRIRLPDLTEDERRKILSFGRRADMKYEALRRVALERMRAIVKIHSVVGASSRDPQEAFRALVTQWRSETASLSSASQIVTHPAYRRIVGMGDMAVPLILHDLAENGPDHWFAALTEITGENPVKKGMAGDFKRMTEAWLSWAEQRGYLRLRGFKSPTRS